MAGAGKTMVKEIREVAERAGGAAALESSRFRGVRLVKKSGRWKSEITIDNKKTHLGIFDMEDEAARAYDRVSIWCRTHGKTKKGGYKLNFDSSNYADEEAALQGVDTMEAMVTEIREVAARADGAAASEMSRFRGVILEKKSGRWRSKITIDNKKSYLGTFDEEDEAARAYDRVSVWCKIHGKRKQGGYKLNFDSSNYAGEEAALRGVNTTEAMVKEIKEAAARTGGAAASGMSRFRGVSLEKRSRRWSSRIMIDNKNTYLGRFDEEEEAARAYDRMSIWCKIHGKTKKGDYKLNLDSSNYADEEEELRVYTQADLIKLLKLGMAVSVEEKESVGSGETNRGQKRKQPPHSEDDDDNAADDGDEEADDDSGDTYVADDDKEKEEEEEEVEKEGDDVENEDGSDTSGGSDTGGGGHNLAAELSAVGHIHAATVTVAKETATIGAEIVTIADQENIRLRANNNVKLGDALYSAQAKAAAAAAAIAVKDHNGVSIINIDGGGDDCVGGGGHMDWTSGAGICSGDRHDAGGGGGGNGGGTVGGGSSHQIVVKTEQIEDVPQAICAGTGHAEPHDTSSAFCASACEGGNSSLCRGGAEGDAQPCDSLAGKKPTSSAVTDGALDGELQMTEAAPAKRGMRSDRIFVPIKREILDIGLLRCPRCQGGVLASEIGCNIVTCRAFHPVTFATEQDRNHGRGGYCHFCYHCRVENIGDHCPSPLCPQRVNPEARAEGLRLRNDHSFRNIIDLSDK
jgi:5-hydroxyisourate hydrolase-like protein (transthyretin family)